MRKESVSSFFAGFAAMTTLAGGDGEDFPHVSVAMTDGFAADRNNLYQDLMKACRAYDKRAT